MSDSDSPSASEPIDPELLEILVCPVTRSKLRQEGAELVSEVGGLRYPIHDGIPVLIAEEATLPEGVESLAALERQYRDQISA